MCAARGFTLVIACALSLAASANADGSLPPGRSLHGAAFDRGPRWAAYLMGGTGEIHFPVTSKNPLVQKFVEQGIGQLHGFWYVEAERSFRQAAALDPNCGIAYWGMALANRSDKSRADQLALEAARHKSGLTLREQMYIDALSNQAGYRALMAKFPEDLEAKAFEVWRIWHKDEAIAPPPAELRDALRQAREILRASPMHPIHHAVIHIADQISAPDEGLASALKCGPSAPSIGHMWHMPTHLYYALARGPEAAWCMEASIRTEHARMMHDRVLPDQVALYAHNNEWLVRMLLLLGRVHDARHIASQMIDLPRHPLYNMLESPQKPESHGEELPRDDKPIESDDSSAYYGRRRYLDSLRRYEYWDDLIEACRSGHVELAGPLDEQGDVHVNLGIAHYARGEVDLGDRELQSLRQLFGEQRARRGASLGAVRKVPPGERIRAVSAVVRRFDDPIAHLKTSLVALESYHRLASGFFLNRTQLAGWLAVVLVAEIVVFWLLRRRVRLALSTIVPTLAVCAWLVHAHWALIHLPNGLTDVDLGYLSQKLLQAGAPESAENCAREYVDDGPANVLTQTNLVDVLYHVGKPGEARKVFDALRSLSGAADLDSPPFARLAPIAREFGYPTDWRLPVEIQKSLAGRPSLPALGPLLWRPWTAPDWKLKDAAGAERSLADFHGQPVVLVFFLGRGCLHCKEQLEAFVKREQQIAEAGLKLVAISTDNLAGIKSSLADYGPARFPFLMVADPELKAFQAYRAYDSFEQIPLHATFVIDGEGLCRWQDISFEPFRDVDFVLAESKRLLARPVAPVEPGARVISDSLVTNR
jgi:peroxiredoxin/tetratricopeptide (TPR) repeat protein